MRGVELVRLVGVATVAVVAGACAPQRDTRTIVDVSLPPPTESSTTAASTTVVPSTAAGASATTGSSASSTVAAASEDLSRLVLGAGDLGASVAITALPAGTADRRSPECDGHFPEGTIASVASAQATFTSAADGVKGREVVAQYRSGDAQRLLDGMRTSFAACGSGAALTLSDGTAVTVTYRSVELPTAGARGDVPVVAVSYDVTRSGTSTHQYGVQTYARFGEIVVLTQVEAPSTARAVAVADAALAAVVQRAG